MLGRVLQLIAELERDLVHRVPSVPRETAEVLRLIAFLVASTRDEVKILEIGTGYGYSTLWFLRGVLEAGGSCVIYTIEIREDRGGTFDGLVRERGLGEYVRVFIGNALDVIPSLDDVFDLVFIDARKVEYGDYLRLVYPKLRKGGIVLAHNVIGFRDSMIDFLNEINNEERWRTIVYAIDPQGLSVSVKK